MTVLAHSSHWITSVAYLAPVAGFLGWLGLTTWRERRRGKASVEPDPDTPSAEARDER